MLQQLLLAPPDQRRNQEIGEAEIVERLSGETQRRRQVLDSERRAEPQPVNAGYRNTGGVKPGDDQPSQLLPLAHQHHDIARPGIARLPLDERKAVVKPGFDLLRDRKSTRLNSSHVKNSYAVFCLKK